MAAGRGASPPAALLGALLMGVLLRRAAFAGIEALVCSKRVVPWQCFPTLRR